MINLTVKWNLTFNKITESVNQYLEKFGLSIKLSFNYEEADYDPFAEGSTTKRIHETILPKIILDVKFDHEKIEKK